MLRLLDVTIWPACWLTARLAFAWSYACCRHQRELTGLRNRVYRFGK